MHPSRPSSRRTRRLVGFHGLVGTSAAVQETRKTLVDRAVHGELLLEILSREHTAARGNDLRFGIRQCAAAARSRRRRHRSTRPSTNRSSANRCRKPRRRPQARSRPGTRRRDRHRCAPHGAGGRTGPFVRQRESHRGRRRYDLAAPPSGNGSNVLPSHGHVTSVVVHNRVFSCAMIVAPALPKLLVRAGLLRMPMRVEQRVDAAAAGSFATARVSAPE